MSSMPLMTMRAMSAFVILSALPFCGQREAFNFLEAFAISAAAIGVPLFLALIVAAAGHALRLFASYVSGRPQ